MAPAGPRHAAAGWLIGQADRANPRTALDDHHPADQAWSVGNVVLPLIHGSAYFTHLAAQIRATRPGDLVLFTDWRGDPDERLTGEDCRPTNRSRR